MDQLLYTTRNNIKHNLYVGFNVNSDETFNILEDFLLEKGYIWRGKNINIKLLKNENRHIVKTGTLNINFNTYESKVISYTMTISSNCIYLDEKNIHSILNYLFNICPSYKSKKIVRTL